MERKINDMIKVSVIMPVYNSEKYLKNAIDSVLNQSLKEIELICIDDGSTDKSGEICDMYAKKDSRVRVIHQKNRGLCNARNVGIKIARGEYIGFCDNDDKCLPKMLEDNYLLAKAENADVVRFQRLQIRNQKNGKKILRKLDRFNKITLRKKDIWKKYLMLINAGQGIWNGIYKRELVRDNKILFDEKMKYGYEDKMFNNDVYDKCNVIVLNPEIYYHWFHRIEHSSSRKFRINKIISAFRCYKREMYLCKKYGVDEKGKECARKKYLIQMKEYFKDALRK